MNRFVAVVVGEATQPQLEAVAEVSLTFGTRCALEGHAALVDITGCAHLFGGEKGLVEQLRAKVVALGLKKPSFAVADGPHVAQAIARARTGVQLVPVGAGVSALAPLSLSILTLDDEARVYLEALGVRTVGELQALPVFELERRLSHGSRAALRFIHGEDSAALDWWSVPEVPEARIELEHGVEHLEPLLFVLKGLIDPLCARLEARGELLARAELWVRYEKLPGLVRREQTWEAVWPLPLRESKAVLNVLKLRLEAKGLEAPVREVALRFVQRTKAEPRALHLWSKETQSLSALPTLIAELVAELGEERVGSLKVEDRHAASARSALGTVGETSLAPQSPWVMLAYSAREPLRAQKAEPWTGPTSGRLLVRRQGVEWWKRGFSDAWDSLAVWVEGLNATAWVDLRLGDSFGPSAWMRGWVEG